MSPVSLRLNKAHYPVTVLGYGRRAGIWVQGCSIRCKGCVSRDTWEQDAGVAVPAGELAAWCKSKAEDGLDGVTVSGGEPFDQPIALRALLDELQGWRERAAGHFDFLCYSGYPFAVLETRYADILKRFDAVISGPYAEALPEADRWRGSSNQVLTPLSPLGKARYGAEGAGKNTQKTIQVAVEDGRVWMVGVPARGDMAALEQWCLARGLSLDQVSWRP